MSQSGPIRAGPPSVDFILHNIDLTYHKVRTVRRPYHTSVDKVFVAIAKLMKDEILKIIIVNASAYSLALVCAVKVPEEEYNRAIRQVEKQFLGVS